ncbi:MAG: hypothetical protein ABSG43_19405 [Solirubrobacteraceae bacterium]
MAKATTKQSTAAHSGNPAAHNGNPAAHNGNPSQATSDPTPAAKPARSRQPQGRLQGLIAKRVTAATEGALVGPNQTLMNVQKPVWKAICDRYFRLEISGWERLPDETSLLIGNHSGGSLTMDAWTASATTFVRWA